MNRYIVVNPDLACIQGDIASDSAVRAVRTMESRLSAPTLNASWQVYQAPAGFPAADARYDGTDRALQDLLSRGTASTIANARRAAQASLDAA